MRSTLVGHATLVVQSKNTTLLSDPILFGSLWEEINIHCPKLAIDLDQFPQVDILNISHRHQDHFDIRTLAYLVEDERILAPDAVVLAPNDEILLEVLKELGMKNVRVVEDFESMKIKDFTLTPTPSLNEHDYFPEHGLLIHDGDVTLWNQVDTIVIPEIIQYIQKMYTRIDFMHCRYLPLLEGNFSYHKSLNLPFEEYSSFLKVVKAMSPKFAVPGSAGFRYRDEFAFLNQYSFPTTQEQFVKDLKDFCPEVEVENFYPGDVADIQPEASRILRQEATFVHTVENDGHLVEFKPVAEVPAIRSLTQDDEEHREQKQAVTKFIEGPFLELLMDKPKMEVWKHWKVAYQLELFGRNGSEIWSLDFGSDQPSVIRGRIGKVNLYEGIGVSEFYGLINKTANWDFVGISGQYRTFNNIYRVDNSRFEFYPQEKKFPQPLMEIFPNDQEMDREKFMKDVRRWKGRA
jgi:L-ascorbate metabolism protein UlaG (beta-lactamase superfamily)